MTLSGAAADRRLPMSTANQKQALVHIYNIVTGSSVAVSLDNKFKSEVTKAAQQLKSAGSKEFWSPVFKIKCSVVSFSC
jgi:molybdopterin-containing oxidoreductase family iron-sulfur binding subunit